MESKPIDGSDEFVETELARLRWTRDLDDQTLQQFLAMAQVLRFDHGQVAQDVGQPVTRVLFVVSGTLRVQLLDDMGRETFLGLVSRGGAVGLLAIARQENSKIRAEAIEPCVALGLTLNDILELGSKSKAFQKAMLELSASLFVRVSAAERKFPAPSVVAIVHQSGKTACITSAIANRLSRLGESPCVLSDLPCDDLDDKVAFESLIDGNQCIPSSRRRATVKSWASRGRLLLNLTAPNVGRELIDFLNYAERIFWCVAEGEHAEALEWIAKLENDATWLKEKLCIVWVLEQAIVAPWVPELFSRAHRDFKVALNRSKPEEGMQFRTGIERIVHYIRGVQIGLALGGGAARGMAHLGVLKSLEDHGIVVDRIAGTSAGAMTGTIYALGLAPKYATECFKNDLLPSWMFRQLPAGGYWYLLYKYRRGLFEPMLRKYLQDFRLEQLSIPITTVSVDLVDAEPRINSNGDATRAILESINLPPLSLPLMHGQQAIVDGGLLNNVPADVLVKQGCNFVIASTVTAKIERDFMEIRKRGQARRSLFFSSLKVIMRQALVQSYSMNAVGVAPADFVIAPDVSQFDLSEFTRADEMAAIGAETANQKAIALKERLRLLDIELF